ncbi:MAG: hypothetical protein OXL37_15510 [Chloroflexota bacterium]|nr:hypothetical protein [Chloroflexota bacterium]MDE2961878.1 hypothetical protein [Chloroflexota bacterium]
MLDRDQLRRSYDAVRRACRADWRSDDAGQAIIDLAVIALQFLDTDCDRVGLTSLAHGKEYVSFERNGVVARPVNRAYFTDDWEVIAQDWRRFAIGNLNAGQIERMMYTVALAPCLAIELFNRNDKKSPATYFECMVGHLFAKSLGIEPTRSASLPVAGRRVRMTMDFLFETAEDLPNIHLPVKMSTRERVVQAWSHQRLLDSAYGSGSYQGTLVAFSETKLDARKGEVVEICVPDQWLAYQTLLARMERIYYFDTPVRYQELTNNFGELIDIKPFHTFFTEIAPVAGQ